MHPIQDLFLESFSYELQFDMHFYMHSYLHKKNYSCKKWVLHLLSTLSTLLGASDCDIGGVVWPPPMAAPALAKVKAALTASSPETCWVAMLSNSMVVFGCLWPSS
jgi:hypothetical protein